MRQSDEKTTVGWGVIALEPWHFAGIYASRDDAEDRAAEMGTNYIVRFGANLTGTPRFMWRHLKT
jgi:hypothetical protein